MRAVHVHKPIKCYVCARWGRHRRQRHYVQRFKAGQAPSAGGGGRGRGGRGQGGEGGGDNDLAADVERVAKAATRAYLDGMAWVYRCG